MSQPTTRAAARELRVHVIADTLASLAELRAIPERLEGTGRDARPEERAAIERVQAEPELLIGHVCPP